MPVALEICIFCARRGLKSTPVVLRKKFAKAPVIWHWVECKECLIRTAYHASERDAIEVWNKYPRDKYYRDS